MAGLTHSTAQGVIGVLDLQGGVHEHLEHLDRLGLPHVRVKKPKELKGLAGLILPGGESTCLSRLISLFDFKDSILQHYRDGMKLWGTCAGAILLAEKVVGEKSCLGLLDIEIQRNSFGSQLESFVTEAVIPAVSADPLPLTFIRAPKILRAGNNVNVLLQIDDYIAAAENDGVMVTVFHPELTGCVALHRYFALKCGLTPQTPLSTPLDQRWNRSSWMRLARIAS